MSGKQDIVRLKPYQYVHVLDNNSNVTYVLIGPKTYTRLDHEVVLHPAPQNCIIVPPDHYCVVLNPVARDPATGEVVSVKGQIKVRIGDSEIRFNQEPFPLYPGEELSGEVVPLKILKDLQALKVRAIRDFLEEVHGENVHRRAGDEWLVVGPCTYFPRTEVEEVGLVTASVVNPNIALKLRARQTYKARDGVQRKAGEEWLIEKPGAYLPDVEEEIVEQVRARILTESRAIHLTARENFKDRFGKERRAGQMWLITHNETPLYIPSPHETVLREVQATVVGPRQFCVVQDYVDEKGVQRLGHKQLRKGLTRFFLHPGESLEGGKIQNIHILGDNEALVLTAKEKFTDESKTVRGAGDRWMIRGPKEYIPPIEVDVVERRQCIPLDRNEGVYIRDTRSGNVRAHIGSTVMLNEYEELWEKDLTPIVENLLNLPRLTMLNKDVPQSRPPREKHKVVTCNIPHNALVQVYDFRRKCARVEQGPELVCLMPDEEFTVMSLSGSKPKVQDYIKTLCLFTGPDFMTDRIEVETSDHARLLLQLSYNWEFEASPDLKERIFSVPDFVGDACKSIASRIRGYVAGESFDQFHKNSSSIIKLAVFGRDKKTGQVRDIIRFPSNGLTITEVDIHSVDPVDLKTRDALTKSVQLAIEITTKSQEATARHAASCQEQEAQGRLERQLIKDKAESEEIRKELLRLEASNAAIESTGASKAESKAQAEARLIEGQTEVDLAQKRADAAKIAADLELDIANQRQFAELEHQETLNELEVSRTRALAKIESDKFKKTIDAVGRDTIKALARAGPELQARLLKSLGLQGYLVTDGTNPINLFNTAKGMTAPPS